MTHLHRIAVIGLILSFGGATGCREIAFLLNGNTNANTADDGGDGLNVNLNGGDVGEEGPNVFLTASTFTPRVGEQVDLNCLLTELAVGDVTYEFTPARVVADAETGDAFYIIEEIDLGVELLFSCRATDNRGAGPWSAEVSVFPTGDLENPPPLLSGVNQQ